MSSDVRDLLHDAASVPSTEADVAGAWRRGRRMRAQRRAASGLAIVAVVALGSLAIANVVPGGHDSPPAGPVTTTAPGCAAPSTTTAVPSWAVSANPPQSVPRLVSPDGNVAVFVFADPMAAGHQANPQNKLLWIVRQPRGGQPLNITATLPGSTARPVHVSIPAASSPGEIYPSTIDVPTPGCWHVALAWNGNHSAINLGYRSVPPKETGVTTTTAATSSSSTTVASATCRTANLALSLGPPNGTAGHINYEIAFRNNGPACVMTGFPGVSFVDSAGQPTGAPAQRNTLTFTPVNLAPGATAYAHLAVNDLGNPPCSADAQQIRVYPPNETASALVTISTTKVCGTSTIDPVLDHSLG